MNLRRIFDVDQPTKDIQATQEEAPRFLSRAASPEQRTRHYIENRWHGQYMYYSTKSEHNRKQHLRLQLFIAVVAVLVPVLLGFNPDIINWVSSLTAASDGWYSAFLNDSNVRIWISAINMVPAVLSGLVAAAAALENVQKYGDNWRAFQTAADGLERERALFEANSGPYRKNKNPNRLFIERSEDVIAQETGRYFAREEQKGGAEQAPDDVFNELMGFEKNQSGMLADDTPIYDDVDVAVDKKAGLYG